MKNQYFWAIFSIIFFILFIFHCYLSTRRIENIKNKAKVKSIMGQNLGISEFIDVFNKYIYDLNKNSKLVNIITALGYLFASLTALYSHYLSLR